MANMPGMTSPLRLTRVQVREVDRIASEEYHIPGIVLMENAAIGATRVAMEMLGGGAVLIFCGGGNNGGDGLAIARHLHNRGVPVQIALCTDPAKYVGDALINWEIVRAMGLTAGPFDQSHLTGPSLIIDAIFGTGLTQAPRPPFERVADAVNKSGIPVLAVDVPSGLDCDTGRPFGACIRATRTITFVAEKVGFANSESRAYTGPVTVADIGAPAEILSNAATIN